MARKRSNTPAPVAAPATPSATPDLDLEQTIAAGLALAQTALAEQTSPALATLATTVQAVAAPAPTPASVRAAALATLAASANPPAWLATPIAATLPPSLIAKGAGLLQAPKGIPAALQSGHYVTNGLLYQRARAHNLAWATTCANLCSRPGGATVAEMVAAGVGLHSVQAYLKRGWFVPAPAAQA